MDYQYQAPPPARPTSGTVFGVLSLILAAFAILSTLAGHVMNFVLPDQQKAIEAIFDQGMAGMIWYWLSGVIGIGLSCWLIGVGIGLLRDKVWARKQAIYYSAVLIIYLFIATPITVVLISIPTAQVTAADMPPEVANAATIGGIAGTVCGSIMGLIFPVLMIYFMMRPNVEAWYDTGGNPYGASPGGSDQPPAPPTPGQPY